MKAYVMKHARELRYLVEALMVGYGAYLLVAGDPLNGGKVMPHPAELIFAISGCLALVEGLNWQLRRSHKATAETQQGLLYVALLLLVALIFLRGVRRGLVG